MEVMTGGAKEIGMAHEVYYEFHQNLEQLRRHGARGGKATVRNRRERRECAAAEAPQREPEAAPQLDLETTAAAIARLDQQCPWLRGAEKRFSNRSRRAV